MKDIILCIDDEEDLLELIEFNLSNAFKDENYEVIGCLNAKMARRFLENENIALILIDRNLVTDDGLNFIKEVKGLGYDIPTIFLSALGLPKDRVRGLEVADDYITKPFDLDELIARIRAVLRRYRKSDYDTQVLKYKSMSLDIRAREISIDDIVIDLSPLETRIMQCFLQNASMVLGRDFLIENAWENKLSYQENSVNVAVKRLRKKIEEKGATISIKSVRGEGYKLC